MAQEGPEAETCVCGAAAWHTMVEGKILWCKRCGALRNVFQTRWRIPLDRAGELARSTEIPEEEPTRPGTPHAKEGKK